jgi:hypothetical protein
MADFCLAANLAARLDRATSWKRTFSRTLLRIQEWGKPSECAMWRDGGAAPPRGVAEKCNRSTPYFYSTSSLPHLKCEFPHRLLPLLV